MSARRRWFALLAGATAVVVVGLVSQPDVSTGPESARSASPGSGWTPGTGDRTFPHPLPSASAPLQAIEAPASEELAAALASAVGRVRLAGHVTDLQGNPIGHATILLSNPLRGPQPLDVAQSAPDGSFAFERIERHSSENTFDLLALAEALGFGSAGHQVSIGPEASELVVDLRLGPAAILAGHVRLANGSPAAGATVIAVRTEWDAPTRGCTETGPDGAFRLASLSPGSVLVAVAPEGGAFQEAGRFRTGNESVEISLAESTGRVVGQVVGHRSRSPKPGVSVALLSEILGIVARTESDTDGRFAFEDVPMGSWEVGTEAPPRASAGISLRPDEASREVILEVLEPARVAGTVIDIASGEPVAGFHLRVGESPGVAAVTDGEGRFAAMVPLDEERRERNFATVYVEIEEPGWISADGSRGRLRPFDSPHTLQSLRLEVQHGLPLGVTTVTPRGEVIENAGISFVAASGGATWGDRSGASGRGTLLRDPLAPAGQVIGSHPMWPLILSHPVAADDTETVAAALEVTEVHLHTVDEAGESIAEATVDWPTATVAVNARPFEQFLWRDGQGIRTDRRGHTTLTRMPRCPIRLSAHALASGEELLAVETVDLGADPLPTEITLTLRPFGLDTVEFGGRVIDVLRRPVEGATVLWSGASPVSTDRDGRFHLRVQRRSLWSDGTVTAAGYEVAQLDHMRVLREDLEVVLVPHVQIRGQLRAPNGSPAPSHTAMLWHPARNHWSAGWEANGGGQSLDGSVYFGIPGEAPPSPLDTGIAVPAAVLENETFPLPMWVLLVTADQAAAAGFTVSGEPNEVIDVGTVTLRRGLRLGGRVVDPSGQPIAGAAVWLESVPNGNGPDGTPMRGRATADEDGQFALFPLSQGTWRIGIIAEGHVPRPFEIDLATDVEQDFVLEPTDGATLTVHVLDAQRQPVAGAQVGFSQGALGWRGLGRRTDATGTARFSAVAPVAGQVSVTFTSGSLSVTHSADIEVPAAGCEETVDLSTWPRLTFRVTRGGEPQAGESVQIQRPNTNIFTSGRTDAAGVVSLPITPGEVTVWCGVAQMLRSVTVSGDASLEIDLGAR